MFKMNTFLLAQHPPFGSSAVLLLGVIILAPYLMAAVVCFRYAEGPMGCLAIVSFVVPLLGLTILADPNPSLTRFCLIAFNIGYIYTMLLCIVTCLIANTDHIDESGSLHSDYPLRKKNPKFVAALILMSLVVIAIEFIVVASLILEMN